MTDESSNEHPRPARGVAGLVLAGGAGQRFGGPKALARTPGGKPWLEVAVDLLRSVRCDPVWVVLGAEGERAEDLVPAPARVVHASDWARGLSATLAAGITAARREGCDAVVIMPVDTPDASASAVSRIIEAAGERPRSALVQATYGGRPGHPVLVGANHFDPLVVTLEAAPEGDRGARPYLLERGVLEVECADLWDGADIDERPLPPSGTAARNRRSGPVDHDVERRIATEHPVDLTPHEGGDAGSHGGR